MRPSSGWGHSSQSCSGACHNPCSMRMLVSSSFPPTVRWIVFGDTCPSVKCCALCRMDARCMQTALLLASSTSDIFGLDKYPKSIFAHNLLSADTGCSFHKLVRGPTCADPRCEMKNAAQWPLLGEVGSRSHVVSLMVMVIPAWSCFSPCLI